VNLVPRRGLLLLGGDSAGAAALQAGARSAVETFGLSDGATWQAHGLATTPRGTTFHVRHRGRPFGTFEAPLLGAHNVRNALAALAVGAAAGLDAQVMASALATFRGIKRRLELKGRVRGVTVYDDFAHHPTAVAETLAAIRLAHPADRIWAVFEPRSASSCRQVFQHEFARAFDEADEVVVARVFRTSLPEQERLSTEALVAEIAARGRRARQIDEVDDIVRAIAAETRDGDLVVIMSNGGFGGIHQKLLAALADGS
jgi:UDP-N-acetylmuramate: L-alanyl-gamma-D-glutamyl-meso-diaminopimelate ligase